jgi:predicted Zn-dependent protease
MAPKVRKGRWVWQTLFGTEQEMIAAEKTVGHDLAQEVLTQLTRSEPKMQSLVAQVGESLSARLRGQRRDFIFEVVDDRQPNAFALPGGYVFVTDSMLDLCRSHESQVAFVLAHEMAHVLKGHTMERIMLDSAVSVASNMTVARGAVGAWARKAGIGAIQNVHSHERELEADAFAARLSRAAGYDAMSVEQLLLACSQGEEESDLATLYHYFRSHPPARERIAAMRSALRGRR